MSIKDSILFLNGMFDLERFSPTDKNTKLFEAFANENSIEMLNDIGVKREYFPPYHKMVMFP